MLYNRWCTLQQVGNSFNKLKKLILLEEFKSCVPVKVKTYLEEQKVDELQRATILADDYKLTHQSMSSNVEMKSVTTSKPKGTVSVPPQAVDKASTQSRHQDQLGRNRMTLRSGPVCAYCKCQGHLLSECRALDKKDKKKGNALRSQASKTPVTFKPFILKGSVSTAENSAD